MGYLENLKAKTLLLADPNSGYTQEDFDKEFFTIMGDDSPYRGFLNESVSVDPDWHKLKINFSNKSDNTDPEYATNGSSGFDLRANLVDKKSIILNFGERALIPTGLYFELPENFEIQVRPRSGLAAKNGVTVLNTPGTIDSDYRGEIKVIIINLGAEPFTISHGDRIAQAIVAHVTAKNVIALTKINDVATDTERGSGGFGSTGVQ